MHVTPPINTPKPFRAPCPHNQEPYYSVPHVAIEANDVLFTIIDAISAEHTPSLTVSIEGENYHVIPRPHLTEFLKFLARRTSPAIYTTMKRSHLDAILKSINKYVFSKSEEREWLEDFVFSIYDVEQCLETPDGYMKSMIYMTEHYEQIPMSMMWLIDLEEGLVDFPFRKITIPKFSGDMNDRGLVDFILSYGQ
jgi:hypothetical protein